MSRDVLSLTSDPPRSVPGGCHEPYWFAERRPPPGPDAAIRAAARDPFRTASADRAGARSALDVHARRRLILADAVARNLGEEPKPVDCRPISLSRAFGPVGEGASNLGSARRTGRGARDLLPGGGLVR